MRNILEIPEIAKKIPDFIPDIVEDSKKFLVSGINPSSWHLWQYHMEERNLFKEF